MNRRDFLAASAGLAALPLARAVAAEKPSGVPFVELLPYEGTARRLRCRWDDRYRLANELLGRCVGKGNIVLMSAPSEHPRRPGLYAAEIEITGHGLVWTAWPDEHGPRLPSYEHAHILVRYKGPEFIPGDAPSWGTAIA